MTIPQVDILILSRNRSFSLFQAVASIREFTRWPYRVTIQDHDSSPGERAHMQRLAGKDCQVLWADKFLSCLEGRRLGLDHIDSAYVVFLDDDVRVGQFWLTRLMEVMLARPNAGAVTCNVLQDGDKAESGLRRLAGNGELTHAPWCDIGQAQACIGGATLYRTEALRKTEFKREYNGGFEDWDQTLQITKNQGLEIWGSEACVIHKHGRDSYSETYAPDRWRWAEVLDAAIAIWQQWGIRSGVRTVAAKMLLERVKLRADQWEAIRECGLAG